LSLYGTIHNGGEFLFSSKGNDKKPPLEKSSLFSTIADEDKSPQTNGKSRSGLKKISDEDIPCKK